jgi:hypothetical protein
MLNWKRTYYRPMTVHPSGKHDLFSRGQHVRSINEGVAPDQRVRAKAHGACGVGPIFRPMIAGRP